MEQEQSEAKDWAQIRDEYHIVQPACAVRETGGVRAIFLHANGSIVHKPVILWILTEQVLFGGSRRTEDTMPDVADEDLPPIALVYKHIQTCTPEMMGFFANGDDIECVKGGLRDYDHADTFLFLRYAHSTTELREALKSEYGIPDGEYPDFNLSDEEKKNFESSLIHLERFGWESEAKIRSLSLGSKSSPS